MVDQTRQLGGDVHHFLCSAKHELLQFFYVDVSRVHRPHSSFLHTEVMVVDLWPFSSWNEEYEVCVGPRPHCIASEAPFARYPGLASLERSTTYSPPATD